MLLSTQTQFQSRVHCNDNLEHTAHYKHFHLRSVYQAIFDRDLQVIGVEALVRITDENKQCIRPDMFFDSPKIDLEDKINVERLSRVIHIRNFANSIHRDKQLFLNVLPSAGEFFALEDIRVDLLSRRIKELDLSANQIVMEVVEQDANDERCLKNAMKRLSDVGFQIAIDDFGMQASNHQRVEEIKPNILKIDRSLLLAYMGGNLEPLLNGLDLAKRVDAKVVVEGIETAEQLEAMKLLNIDFYQGYYLAMPQCLEMVNLHTIAS